MNAVRWVIDFFRWMDTWIDEPIPTWFIRRLAMAIGLVALVYVLVTTGNVLAALGVYLVATGAAFLNFWIFSKLHNWTLKRHKQVDGKPD